MNEKTRILVVDDNPSLLAGTCRILKNAGYETLEAATGMDGLRLIKEYNPDLVLLDVNLPDINGDEICRRIKTDVKLAETYVVLISSINTDTDHQTSGLEIGADGYIARPVSNRDFLARVNSLLRIKRTEKELRTSELKFRTVANFTYDWEYWITPDGNLEYTSPSCERVTGYRPDEFLKNPKLISAIVHPDDRHIIGAHSEIIEPDNPHIVDFRIVTRTGEERWIEHRCQPVFGDNGEWLGRRVSNRDITDRKQTEEDLRSTLSRFYTILSSLYSGVLLVTDDGVVEFANQAFCDLCDLDDSPMKLRGLTAQETIGKIKKIFGDPDKDISRIIQIVAENRPVKGEEISGADGRTFLRDFIPIVVEGKPYGRFWYHTDITERKRAEQEKHDLQAQLFQSQKMEALGTLVGGIAHDFNNMLQIVLGYSQILLDDKQKTEQGYRELQTIIETCQGGADLVKKLLALGQQGQVIPVPLDLNHQISQLTTLISRTLPQVVQLELNLIDGPTTIRSDHGQIDQLVMSLAINASEAMPNGGALKISTSVVSLDDDYCKSRLEAKPGPYVMLSVRDTGRGMDKETLTRIFDPFFSTKERGSTRGTGLGLSVVRGIVQQQGGHVTCESEPGKGTEFKIYFPSIEEPLMSAKMLDPQVQSGTPQTILVVEDNVPVAELERRGLENAGYSVITATSGQEALDVYQTGIGAISMVILDLVMPEMTGKDCLMELLKIDPSVKVLIASGYSPGDELHKEIGPFVKGFVHKPFGMAQLLDSVEAVLRGK